MTKACFKRFLMFAMCIAFVLSLASEGGTCVDPFWSATSTTGAPTARGWHGAVWTGSKMIVWGGFTPTPTNTGAIYNPLTDTWTSMSTLNAPTARGWAYLSVVWTGSKMLVWGDDASGDNTPGGIYDPATDSWTSMTTVNEPSTRWLDSKVWTGSKMIVWGGQNNDTFVSTNTGALYDPATDSWTPVSTTGAPTARVSHKAVWTGSKMIIWGGVNDSGVHLDDGGIYDPATDTWSTMSNTNGPTGVGSMMSSAVWTGSKMLIWGERDANNNLLNTGGIYDPVTDTWSSITTLNAPTARDYQSVVWTGDKMIIWGGRNGTARLDTGAAYDPVTDTWSATPTLDAPSGRGEHSAVWTGNKMLIWGGLSSSYYNTGGILYGY